MQVDLATVLVPVRIGQRQAGSERNHKNTGLSAYRRHADTALDELPRRNRCMYKDAMDMIDAYISENVYSMLIVGLVVLVVLWLVMFVVRKLVRLALILALVFGVWMVWNGSTLPQREQNPHSLQ